MPETRASNKDKRPGKCVLDAESEAEAKPKRKRRTKEEMRVVREGQERAATEKAAHEKERQNLLRKVAELEMKMQADDLKKGVRLNAEGN